jgi:hypothetical protein
VDHIGDRDTPQLTLIRNIYFSERTVVLLQRHDLMGSKLGCVGQASNG